MMSMSHSFRFAHAYSREHRMLAAALLKLGLQLRTPHFPEATRGLKGLRIADEILRDREQVGVLIGSLPWSIWNRGRPCDLSRYGDVDVLVPSADFRLRRKFEGGIDWWLPCSRRVKILDGPITASTNAAWFRNGNNVVLSYGVATWPAQSPGLYLPDVEFLTESVLHEVLNAFRHSRSGVEDEVLERCRELLSLRVCCDLAPDLSRFFDDGSRVLWYKSPSHEIQFGAADLLRLEYPTLEAIRAERFEE